MVTRINWGILVKDYKSQFEDFDLYEIKRNACKFYDCIVLKNVSMHKQMMKVLDAEKYVNNTRRLVKNICSPQENSLINKEDENYSDMNENLGRVDLEIKQTKEDAIKAIRLQHQLVSDDPIIKIEEYKKLLQEALDNLAYHPLRQALDKFKNKSNNFVTEKDGKQIEVQKDKNLLIYLIYVGVLHSSESMGIPTSQKGKQLTKTFQNKTIMRKEDV